MKINKHNCFSLLYTLAFSVLVSQQVLAQKQKVSCIGNSITYGYDLPNPLIQSYPGQLQVLLGTTGWEVGNFGDSGRTMLKAGGYSYWDSQRYKDVLASSPIVVMIELGTNDSKRWLWDLKGTEFKSDYKEMVQSIQNLPSKPEIWIGLLIPGEKADWDIFNSYIKDKVNPKIKEIALERGLGLIDLYTELDKNKPEWYLADHVHPSVSGAGIIARKVKEMLLMSKPEISYANGKVTAPDGDDYQWYLDGVPVASGNSGKLKEMVVTTIGNYKVSVKLSVNNETRIVSKELNVSVLN
ncbi:MAG: GDSL-type esterase/lipase family protein [Bacteroidia bacterium]|nr:GDSL-type esterase/lipase family protein [Bacteroidia bacterium]